MEAECANNAGYPIYEGVAANRILYRGHWRPIDDVAAEILRLRDSIVECE